MARPKFTRPLAGQPRRRTLAPKPPDLHSLLGRFCDALALVTVAVRSLEARERRGTEQEALVLRVGLNALDAVYGELDAASAALRRARL